MADQRLVSYIQSSLRRGHTPDQIRKTLLNQGWRSSHIEEAMRVTPGQPMKEKLSSRDMPLKKLFSKDGKKKKRDAKSGAPEERPPGITIIGILGILGSLIWIMIGIAVFFLVELITSLGDSAGFDGMFAILSPYLMILAIPIIAYGAIGVFTWYRLYQMRKIGYILAMVIYAIFIAITSISFVLTMEPMITIYLIIPVLIIVYLYTKRQLFN